MSFTADQYSQIASGYDKAAGDPSIAPEKREELTRKAEWFRFLAEREKGTLPPPDNLSEGDRVGVDFSFEPSSPAPRRSLKPFLTVLWVTGAAIYLIGTVLFTNIVSNPFRSEEASRQVALPGAFTRKEEETARLQPAVPRSSPTPEKRHAISPHQPAYEAPGLVVPPSSVTENENSPSPATRLRTEQASAPPADGSEREILKVTGATTIRNGPSPNAKVIGIASPGAELQVQARENGWVQFVDPSSGNFGWIESHLLVAASPTGENSGAATSSAEAPSLYPDKPKPVKKRLKKKPTEPAQVAKQRPSRPSPPVRDRAYADLPEDEAFLVDRLPRRGFFARRRMVREGLMSPDFKPPQ